MTDAEVLKRVRKTIAKSNSVYCFICHQINFEGDTVNQINSLKMWISTMLGSAVTYQNWLAEEGFLASKTAIIQGRLAWLDWMIAECERNNW